MSIEEPPENGNSISLKLRRQALEEIEDSGRCPSHVTPQEALSTLINAAHKTLQKPIDPKGFKSAPNELNEARKKVIAAAFGHVGIAPETARAIVDELESKLNGPGLVH